MGIRHSLEYHGYVSVLGVHIIHQFIVYEDVTLGLHLKASYQSQVVVLPQPEGPTNTKFFVLYGEACVIYSDHFPSFAIYKFFSDMFENDCAIAFLAFQ